jgi:hypothetical protein
MTPLTCVLTVHVIGFQQPPSDGHAGYADRLHALLGAVVALGQELGNDPKREAGPVYVQKVRCPAVRNIRWCWETSPVAWQPAPRTGVTSSTWR